MRTLEEYLTKKLIALSGKAIDKEQYEIYLYGMYCVTSTVIPSSLILLTALPEGHLFVTLLWLVCFYKLRSLAGGFHAKTQLRCLIESIIVGLSAHMLSPLCSRLPWWCCGIVFSGILLFSILEAPVPHPNKILDPARRSRNKKILILLLCILFPIAPALPDSFSGYLIHAVGATLILGIMGVARNHLRDLNHPN